MDSTQLKENFEKQLADAEKQIDELQQNLAKANEYRTKLLGGLETLSILYDDSKPEDADTPPETSFTEVVE